MRPLYYASPDPKESSIHFENPVNSPFKAWALFHVGKINLHYWRFIETDTSSVLPMEHSLLKGKLTQHDGGNLAVLGKLVQYKKVTKRNVQLSLANY